MSVKRFYRPKTVSVLGQTYKVIYESQDELDIFDEDSKELYGYCAHVSREIHIDKDLDKDSTYRVLRHEIMHCILAISGLAEKLTDDLEEALATLMESGYDDLNIKPRSRSK